MSGHPHAGHPCSIGDLSTLVVDSLEGFRLAIAPTHNLLAGWLNPVHSTQVDPGNLKGLLAERGVNNRGWRLYLEYGDVLFQPLEAGLLSANQSQVHASNAIAYLRVLQACEMDVLPPPELAASLARWCLPPEGLAAIPPLFFRAAWKACVAAQYSKIGVVAFIERQVVPLAAWFFTSGNHETMEDARLKAGWETLRRLRRVWFITHAPTVGEEEWPSILRSYVWDTFRFNALFSEAQLELEGEVMRHCVGSYADRCRNEVLRIYSVRHYKTGERVATLSVNELRSGVWEIDQFKGPGNADVEQRVWRAAKVFLDKLGYVSSRPGPVKQFLDGLRLIAYEAPEEWVDAGF
jgi:hypothetical protein